MNVLANIEEEALCATIDYCNCGGCVIAGHCQLSLDYMCPKGEAFYDGFVKAAELLKGGAE